MLRSSLSGGTRVKQIVFSFVSFCLLSFLFGCSVQKSVLNDTSATQISPIVAKYKCDFTSQFTGAVVALRKFYLAPSALYTELDYVAENIPAKDLTFESTFCMTKEDLAIDGLDSWNQLQFGTQRLYWVWDAANSVTQRDALRFWKISISAPPPTQYIYLIEDSLAPN